MRRSLCIIALLAFGGLLVSSYLVYQHYKPAGGAFCNVNDYVSCDIVNKSKYAEVAGIPVAVMGVFAYVMIFSWALFLLHKNSRSRFIHKELGALTLFSFISCIFSLYLTIMELWILQAVCIFCLTQQLIILLIFLLSLFLWQQCLRTSKKLLS